MGGSVHSEMAPSPPQVFQTQKDWVSRGCEKKAISLQVSKCKPAFYFHTISNVKDPAEKIGKKLSCPSLQIVIT